MDSSLLSLVTGAIVYFTADMVVCSQQVLRKLMIAVLQEKEESNDVPTRIMQDGSIRRNWVKGTQTLCTFSANSHDFIVISKQEVKFNKKPTTVDLYMTRATLLWYLKGLPQSINLPPEHMPEVSKEAEVTGWP